MTEPASTVPPRYFVVSVNFRRPLAPDEAQAQREFLGTLTAQGVLLLTGPLDVPAGAAGQGMVLLRAESKEKAAELYSNAPVVRQNLADWSLREWKLLSGRLIPALAGA